MSTPPPLKVLDKRSIVTPRARSGNPPNMSWSSIKPPGRFVLAVPEDYAKPIHRLHRFKTLAECNEARLARRDGVKTVQSECGILATATPAPLRKKPGKYILAQHRALLQFETQALQHRLYESHGVREASWISLSGCHPKRVQANAETKVQERAA